MILLRLFFTAIVLWQVHLETGTWTLFAFLSVFVGMEMLTGLVKQLQRTVTLSNNAVFKALGEDHARRRRN